MNSADLIATLLLACETHDRSYQYRTPADVLASARAHLDAATTVRAPGIAADALAAYLSADPPADWALIDNLDADEVREIVKLAVPRLRLLEIGVTAGIGALCWDHNVGLPDDECAGCSALGLLHRLMPDVPTTP